MKRLVYSALLLTGLAMLLGSCEKDSTNPGDYGIRGELKLLSIKDSLGTEYALNVKRAIDTTYVRFSTKNDTVKNEDGTPKLTTDGKLIMVKDTFYFPGKITAKYTEYEMILLPPGKNRLNIELETNARWYAVQPSFGDAVPWYFVEGSTGGGNAIMRARVDRNRNFFRKVNSNQYIITSDSLVMNKIVFGQKGERDKSVN